MEQWVSDHYGLIWGAASVVALAGAGLVPVGVESENWLATLPYRWILLFIGAVTFVLSQVAVSRQAGRREVRQDQLATLRGEKRDLRREVIGWNLATHNVMDRLCEAFAEAIGADAEERVTIYQFQREDSTFVRMARFSKNPNRVSSGRTKYPSDEGVVGAAWNAGKASLYLPSTPGNRRDWVNTMHEKSGVPKATLHAMTMTSRSLIGKRIDDPANRRPCAVVIFESMRYRSELNKRAAAKGYRDADDAVDEIFASDLGCALADAVGVVSRLGVRVDPAVAAQEGFG